MFLPFNSHNTFCPPPTPRRARGAVDATDGAGHGAKTEAEDQDGGPGGCGCLRGGGGRHRLGVGGYPRFECRHEAPKNIGGGNYMIEN